MSARVLIVLALSVATLLSASVVAEDQITQQPRPTDGPSPERSLLQYRRLLVPADKSELWPTGTETYIPMRAEEFERLVGGRGESSDSAISMQAPVITSGFYEAKLDDTFLVGADGRWQIELGESASKLLPVVTNLAFGHLNWHGEVGDAVAPRADVAFEQPLLGQLASGQQALLVPTSGTLSFQWSLQQPVDDARSGEYRFVIPKAVTSVVEIILPKNLIAEGANHEIAEQVDAEGEMRRWRFRLGSQTTFLLRVREVNHQSLAGSQPGVHEQLTYDISERGVELAAEFELEGHSQVGGQVEFDLDADLTILAVKMGGKALKWSSKEPEDSKRQLSVSFEKPRSEAKPIVRILALAPLQTEKDWRLPSIRARGVFWKDGKVLCRVLTPLVVQHVGGISCRQLSGGALPAPLSGESLEFETFDADRAIELAIQSEPSEVGFVTATSLTVNERELVARINCRGIVRGNDLLSLTIPLASGWVVDSLEAVAGAEIANWQIDGATTPNQLHVAFAVPPLAGQLLQLQLICRRSDWVPGHAMRVGELLPVRFDGRWADRYLSIDLVGELTLHVNDAGKVIPSAKPPADIAELLSQLPGRMVLQVDEETANIAVMIQKERPAIVSNTEIVAALDSGRLVQSFRIACNMGGKGVETIRVRFAPPPGPIRWQESLNDGTSVHARLQLDPSNRGEEVWELAFARPRSEEFVLSAASERPFAAPMAIALAAVEGAISHSGTVTLRAGNERISVRCRAHGPQPLPVRDDVPRPGPTPVAAFSYTPNDLIATAAEGALVLEARRESNSARAIIWRASLFSNLSPSGNAEHVCKLDVERFDLDELALSLPPQMRIVDAAVEGKSIGWAQAIGSLKMPLPREKRFVTVALQMTTSEPTWGFRGQSGPVFPIAAKDVPVITREWNVAVPPEYELYANRAVDGAPVDTAWRRMFGYLGRSGAATRFDPLLRPTWLNGEGGRYSRGKTVEADRLLQQLASAAFGRQPSANWGQAVAKWADEIRKSGKQLVIDRFAVGARGLGPDAPIPLAEGVDSLTGQGQALLLRTGLAIILDADRVVVTANDSASRNQQQGVLTRLGKGCVYQSVAPAAPQGGAEAQADRGIAVAAWLETPKLPWAPLTSNRLDGPTGWNHYRIAGQDLSDLEITIIDRRALLQISSVVLIVAVSVGIWLFSRRLRLLGLLLTAAVVAATVVPQSYSLPAASLVLGFVIALVWSSVAAASANDKSAEAGNRTDQAKSAVRRAHTAAIVSTALFCCMAGCWTVGAEKGEPQLSRDSFRVLIPVDQARKPVGDFYYVPLELRKQLLELASDSKRTADWLVGSAAYRGDFQWNASHNKLAISTIKANFELHVFRPDCKVRLPLSGRANNPPTTVLLDGEVLPCEVDAKNGTIWFEVREAGRHSLEVVTVPMASQTAERSIWNLLIPKVADATAAFGIPPDAGEVSIASAAGPVSRTDQGRSISGRLGGVDRLQIRCLDTAVPDREAVRDIEQLLWLDVQPGAVALKVKFKFKPGGNPEKFQVAVPRDLRLMPTAKGQGFVGSVVSANDDRQIVEFTPEDDPRASDCIGSFLLSRVSGVGRLQLPSIVPLDGRVSRRLLGLSLDPNLVLDEAGLSAATAAPLNEWTAAWGASDAVPQRAYALPPDQDNWSLGTTPVETKIAVDPEMTLIAGANRLAVQYQAALHVFSSRFFQYELLLPDDLKVDAVSVLEGRTQQVARFTREGKRLTVFLSAAPLEKQSLTLSGSIALSAAGTTKLPNFQFLQAKQNNTRITLLRRPDSLVSLLDPVDLERQEEEGQAKRPSQETTVAGRYVAEGPDYSATLKIAANKPNIRLVQLTTPFRRGAQWYARADCRMVVADGLLDAARFKVSDVWQGPFTCKPEWQTELTASSNTERELVIRPPAPLDGEVRFEIEGPIDGGLERRGLPPVVLSGASQAEYFVALPKSVGEQHVAWTTQGLRSAAPPTELRTTLPSAENFEFYEAVNPSFVAEVAGGAPGERLQADLQTVFVKLAGDGEFFGISRIDIEPHGQSYCTVRVPVDVSLIQVILDGVPALFGPQAKDRCRVDLRSTRLPQRLDMVFRGKLSAQSGITAPRIEGRAPKEVCWSFESRYPVTSANRQISEIAFSLGQLERDQRNLDHTAAAASGDELVFAYQSSWQRFDEDRRLLVAAISGGNPTEANGAQAQATRIQRQEESLRRQVREVTGRELQTVPRYAATAIYRGPQDKGMYRSYFVTSDNAPEIKFRLEKPSSALGARVAIAAIAVGLSVVICRPPVFIKLTTFSGDWLPAALALGGIVWWLFLVPSLLGFLLFVCSAAWWLTRGLARRRFDKAQAHSAT